MRQSRYRRFGEYLRQRFGGPVRKISLDAGFTCPNRDGRLSSDGCVFCLPRSYAPASGFGRLPLTDQLRQGIEQGKRKGSNCFIAYFQAYTNTYADPGLLRETYDAIRSFQEIKVLAIGTRPDCVDEAVLEVIAEYLPDYEVWLEYGLQSANDKTLARLNRGHDARAFFNAMTLTRQYPGIKIAVHVILGLPGETAGDEARTADSLAQLRVEGVKIHPLHVVKQTRLEQLYLSGGYSPLTCEEYAGRAAGFLERLWPETVIQRLSADCPEALLVAPLWLRDKNRVLAAIDSCMEGRDTWQGRFISQ